MNAPLSSPGALRPLRPHQERALEALRRSLAAGKRRPMLQAPTGFGKTITAAHIIQRALDKGNSVAFCVPALSLIDQTVAAFEREGIHRVGVMQGDHERTDSSMPVQVCSVQTVARREKPDVDLVMIDEAQLAYQSIFRWMEDCPTIPFIGLSATPWTKGLGQHYDDLIIAATTEDLIRSKYLSDFVTFAPSEPDLEGVHTIAGDFNEGELAERCNTTTLVGDIIQTWLDRGENRPTLCYGVDRAHAMHLKQRFDEAGTASEYIDCFTDRPERERIFDRLRAGDIKVICNVATLTVGVDLPMVSCIIDARPTKSEMRYVQTIGRGLRTAPGKDNCLILDHAGNALRLGLVTDIHHEHLDDGEPCKASDRDKGLDKPKPRLCDECKAVLPYGTMVCTECGAVKPAKTPVLEADGRLVVFGSNVRSSAVPSMREKSDFYGELLWIARDRRYVRGWAANQYRERFGVWPNDPRVRHAEPRPPSLKTSNWIRARQIAYAKGRRAHG